MDHSIFKQNVKKLVEQRNGFLFFSLLLSVVVVLLSTLLLFKKERIVVLPTTGPSFWIEDQKASGSYVEKMGLFLSDLLLNRSPADVEKRNQIILQHVHPSAYHKIRKQLQQEGANIVRSGQAFFFQAHRSYVENSLDAFVVEGEFYLLVGKDGQDPYCSQKEKKKYTLRFLCENGRLLLTSLNKEEV
jgi:conjugal transfer pilus assembly protein TraE